MNTALAAAFKYLPKVIEYARKDLAKRYSLLEDWEIRLKDAVPAPYEDEQVDIREKRLVIKHYVSTDDDVICDGNTLVPEEVMGIPTVVGSLAHDPLYDKDRLKKIAAAFGWSVAKTRKWADTIYGNILLQLARRQRRRVERVVGAAWAHVSYAGVRVLGGIAHWAYRVFGAVVLAVFLGGGCSGCMSEIVDSFDDPVWEQTEGE
ncbi:MAG TPA: hypothetical protein PLY73_11500 [Candidatus Ozemobacteraceae bacterium]|nr:hypothetical protein [Candidatus Ozemobacteraceae bacterium]